MVCIEKINGTHFQVSRKYLLFLLPCFLFLSCRQSATLFTLLKPGTSGIEFKNELPVSDTSFNILDYIYYYNGGGVATGDINNDGLIDIFFTSNIGKNKLYLNKGNLKFEDITAKAGVGSLSNWKTGVTMADVNGDGLPDIYVCAVGNFKNLHGRNELYINQGNETFVESAAAYGLDISAFSTQATFFDYDKDGDLDMFLVCHSIHTTESFKTAKERTSNSPESGDKLFINEQHNGKVYFREVTREAGIYNSAIGYGLNVITGDFNNDNWDDIYVSNDFHENDYYYLNNRNGTFTETNASAFGHESRSSMGSDAADFNNDGWLDIVTLDMLPKAEKVLKSTVIDEPLAEYNRKKKEGFHSQFSRNCLQLNVDGGRHFSDIGLYSGIAATDWSWSPLAADFDNDGIKDLFITNGIVKRPNDLDYLKFANDPSVFNLLQNGKSADKEAIDKMPSGKIPNYIFKGTDNMLFQDKSEEWGFDKPTLSTGAAYADLDNDGDLDIIINNINSPAMIYRNNCNKISKQNFIDVELKGNRNNAFAYGAKVALKCKSKLQLNYVTGSRGFLSMSTNVLHFGLGTQTNVDTLEVIWPSGKTQLLTHIKSNQKLVLKEVNAVPVSETLLPTAQADSSLALFTDVTKKVKVEWKHNENAFNDFNTQPLIPHMVSTQGPKATVADINHDGLDDFFVCGARNQSSVLFVQKKDGSFQQQQQALFDEDATSEDVNALFFDANGDGFDDLYVVCGGNELAGNKKELLDRLYLNDGKGNFNKSTALPNMYGNKSVAIAADFDKDGDQDLFIGGRVVTNSYGTVPISYLLLNDDKGNFSIAPENIAKGLSHVGMVTDAVWTDKDMDGWPDLVVVGEWMPVTFFKNNKGKLEDKTTEVGLSKTPGLWQSIKADDIDQDGFPDLLVGNWGENSKLKATETSPLQMWVGNLNNDGTTDQILGLTENGHCYSFLDKDDLERKLPFIKDKFQDYSEIAGLTVEEIFGDRLKNMTKLTVNTLSSAILINSGKEYKTETLPKPIQWFPVFAWGAADFNKDGKVDILAGGNFSGVIPYEGMYDAGFGQVVLQQSKGWVALTPFQSGIKISGETRDIKKIRLTNGALSYLICRNNDSLIVIKNKN